MKEKKIITNSLKEIKDSEMYWNRIFEKSTEKVGFPADFYKETESRKLKLRYELDDKLYDRLIKITKNDNISIYVFLLAILGIELFKYNNKSDLTIGSPVCFKSNQNITTNKVLPFKILLNENITFREVLLNVSNIVRNGYKNQIYPLENINQYLFNDIVTVSCAMKNIHKAEHIEHITKSLHNEITFLFEKTENSIVVEIIYLSKKFEEDTIKKVWKIYDKIINSIFKNFDRKLKEIEILTDEEKNEILNEFNDTYAEYPREKTIQELFEEQVEKTPNKIAVMFEKNKLTYEELNKKANQLGGLIRENGIKQGCIVGIMAERSFEMIIGIMAILKSGAAYLPIDPKYPKDRIEYILNDSEVGLVLVGNKYDSIDNFHGNIIDIRSEKIYDRCSDNLEKINKSSDLAYVIYTSGSTGNPKGVMIEHTSLINRLNWMQKKYPLDEEDIILQKTTYTFDVSVWEILWWSLVGASVFMLKPEMEKDPEFIAKVIGENNVSIMHFVPSMFNSFIDYIESKKSANQIKTLKRIFSSGEAITIQQINKFKSHINEQCDIDLINLYGPTEATIDVTYYECLNEVIRKNVPIGKPIDNTKIYIVDKNNRLLPKGIPGELCIAGDGLARGYLNRQELTAEKFVDNPYELGKRMYKTGDLARWLPDGNIEFLGRIDYQVKIRGFRIELGEIENMLLKHVDIKDAIVVDREDAEGNKYLSAYIVSENEVNSSELRKYLRNGLPEYMIPSYFVQLEKMPLTSNGKIDRNALLKAEGKINTGVEYQAARNEIEKKLVEIWEEVLGVENIGIYDDFFDLGGHSLKATILTVQMHKEFQIEIPLKQLFNKPSIYEISKYIEESEKTIYQSIEKVTEDRPYYQASSAQKRMYMLQNIESNGTMYNMPFAIEFKGEIDKEKIEKAIIKIIDKHESLRTSFDTIDGEIVQRINKEIEFKIDCLESSNEFIEDEVNKFIKSFDLNKAPLLRTALIKTEEDKHIMVFDMHHIISDGISMGILVNEFTEAYNGNDIGALKLQYKDYSEWQNNTSKSEAMKKQEEYWLKKYDGEIPVLNLPCDFKRPEVQMFDGNRIEFSLDKELNDKLREMVKETGTTMNMLLLSAYSILLSKYSGQEDIIIGTPIAGRPHADLENIIGVFVNTLALRNYVDKNDTFMEYLEKVKEECLNAYENQDYQFEELVDKLDIKRDMSRNPLFDAMFDFHNENNSDMRIKNMDFEEYNFENNMAKFDLTLSSVETEKELEFSIEYCSKLFTRETINRMKEHYKNILKTIVENRKILISEIDILTDKEKNQIFKEFNDTNVDYPSSKTFQQIFEEQVEKTPDKLAVVFEDTQLSYKELNTKANQLARLLRAHGVKEDSIVGIMMERSIDMIVSILGVLKAGGAYLPIDFNYSDDRIDYILNDSKTKLIITKGKYQEKIKSNIDIKIIEFDINSLEIMRQDVDNLRNINKLNDLAYVIYTSGSTGKPKGAMIEQAGMVNHLFAKINDMEINETSVIAQNASHCFDISVWQFLSAIIVGGKVVIYSDEIILNIDAFVKQVIEDKISILEVVPTYLAAMIKDLKQENIEFKSLRYILVTGEALKGQFVKEWFEIYKNIKMVNAYGPTEASDDITHFIMENKCESDSVPIGYPVQNMKIYILNNNKLCPIGIVGELCVSGIGVGRGYINRPELTAEKFVDNPFEMGKRMYKTGDLARWLPDGNIEFLGRIDHQVKIRGFRIELGEIENTLIKHDNIKETVVIDREDEHGNKFLCAYIVSDKELNISEVRKYLKNSLPEYMIPSYFVQLEVMPMTANGKIDRKALPKLEGEINTGKEYEAARNEVEEKLVEVWEEVLGVKKISINDNFFDLGGHSLKATVLTAKMHKKVNVEIPLKQLFSYPTIKEISKFIDESEKTIYESIKQIEEKEYYKASSAQKRMYMLQSIESQGTMYNIPFAIEFKGEIDKVRIEKGITKLLNKHESLRTSFDTVDGEIVQKINEVVEFKINYIESTEESLEEVISKCIKPFDLSETPLFRVMVIKTEKDNHILVFDIHHIISDGISMGILVNDFVEAYNGNDIGKLRLQYKDYAEWQNSIISSENMKKQEEYWLEKYDGEIPVLNLPYDYKRPEIQTFDGSSIEFSLDKELSSKLRKLVKETGTTMNMLLLSAYNILLSKYSGQKDIVIGTPIAGRPHAELQNIIGMFVNTLALRNYVDRNDTFIEFLKKVKEECLSVYENQDYQFEELVDKLNLKRDMSRNPLFDVMFDFYNESKSDLKLENMGFKEFGYENSTAKFDLTLAAMETEKELEFTIEYCTRLFTSKTINRMKDHYKNILKTIAENKNILISDIELLSKEEKNQILNEFNDTYVDYPRDKTIQELFEEQVKKTPDNIAVIYKDKKVTYKELEEKSNQIARALKEKGLKRQELVGIMFERSIDMIASIIGTLKAGGAYVPIDGNYPINRIKAILSDSKAKYLMTKSNFILNKTDFYYEINSSTEVSHLIYLDNINNIEDDNNLFKTFKVAESLIKFDDSMINKDLTLYYNENRMTFEVYMKKIERLCEFLKNNKLDVNRKVGVMFNNPINKIIATMALKNTNLLFEVIDTNISLDEKMESIRESNIQTIISDSDYLDEIDQIFWICNQLNSYIILDDYSVHESKKEEQLTSLWNIVADESSEEINDYGWQNSYNGEKFSVEEMKEYIDNFNLKLKPYINSNSKVLDIGCGHGLALFEIAPKVKEYLATDMSQIILEKNKRRVEREKLTNVKFRALPASDISKLDVKGYDIVVCCSVIHYFPNTLYLEDVIKGAIEILGDEGIIYLDDLMDTNTRRDLIDSVLQYKKNNPLTLTKTDWSSDLFINSDFFELLEKKYPEIVEVQITPKLGKIPNELTKYRYDVLLKVNKKLKNKCVKKNIIKNRYTADDILGYEECIGDKLNIKKPLKFVSGDNDNQLTDFASVSDFKYLDQFSKEKIGVINKSSDISYVIYTSGSTGKPKGAIVEHDGMVNHIYAKINDLKLSNNSIIAQNASHCFDISVWQFFAALICGGKTVIYPNDLVINIEEFIGSIIEDNISILEVVPSFLEVMIENLKENKESIKKLEYLLVTGEELKGKLVKRWFDIYKNIRMVNAYGPTEVSDDITHYIMDKPPVSNNISIGKPVQNLKIYIVDEQMKLCPIGVKGEIVVSGIGVGRGYLNDEQKTRKVFMEDPFTEEKNVRLYKTGDLGRWLEDGTIEFFGRKDYQVKIRGFRIELGEIESRLMEYSDINSAVVIDREDEKGSKYLCAYVVSDVVIDSARIKKELNKILPYYMIPSYLIQLEKLPLTSNGKVDRKVLPNPEGDIAVDVEFQAPRNEIEERLIEIWNSILSVGEIGINDNFFELGGHSLKATVLMGKIHKELNVEIPLKEIFNLRTIKELSKYIISKEKSIYEEIKKVKKKDYYETSSAQKRMYIIQQLDKESLAYNMPMVFELEGEIDKVKIEEVLKKLCIRHEALRTSFETVESKIVQKIHDADDFKLLSRKDNKEIEIITNQFIKTFELDKSPLFRAELVENRDKTYLLIDMHHIISDGVSMNVLIKEFATLYNGEELKPMKLQYKDFAEWQNKFSKSEDLKKQEEYWIERFQDELPVLNLPYDYERPAVQSFEGNSISFSLGEETTERLNVIAKETGSTMHMLLLSVFNILLSKYSGQEDIIVGTPISGRPHADLENIMGMFVNTLPLRNYPSGEKSYVEFLKEVRKNSLKAYENQSYQFEELIEKIKLKRDVSRNSIFDVVFNMANINDDIKIELNGLTLKEYTTENKTSKFDLTLTAFKAEGNLNLIFEYSSKLFSKKTIERAIEDFKVISDTISKNINININEINILKKDEQDYILQKKNEITNLKTLGFAF